MTEKDNIKAFVRVRPLLSFEDQPAWQQSGNLIKCLDTKNVRNKIGKYIGSSKRQIQQQIQQYSFPFEAIINQNTSSQILYKQHCQPLIDQALFDSTNCTIMAYGQTCSGKTFTTLGVNQYPGIIPCLFRHLFLDFDSPLKKAKRFSFSLSYLQLYNQNLKDLLQKGSNNQSLKIVNDDKWGTDVTDAQKVKVSSYNDCIKFLEIGQNNRSYRAKQNHEMSSRSHTLLRLYVQKWNSDFQSSLCVINIIDLAGSQRLQQGVTSQASLSETASINKSLFQLSNVINKLSDKKKQYIPYRDSKLTRLLQGSLSGNSITMIIFCISPAAVSFSQSLTTLRLAKKAKCIKLQVDTSQLSKQDSKILELQKKLRKKTTECQQLKNKIEAIQIQLVNLKTQIKKTAPKEKVKYNIHLGILFDQQLFTFHETSKNSGLSLSTQQNERINKLQETFLENLYHQYESYCTQIVKIIAQQNNRPLATEIKIEEICMLNMIFKKQDTRIWKIQYLRKQLQQIEWEGNTNQQFYNALKQYISSLEDKKSNRQSNYSSIEQSSNNIRASTLSCTFQKENSNFCNQKVAIHQEKSNNVYCWGYAKDSRVFSGKIIKNGIVKSNVDYDLINITCGAHHSFFISDKGNLYGWGKNSEKQVLNSSQVSISIPTQIQLKYKVLDVAAGWAHSIALTNQGLFSWGNGQDGQLGHGNKDNINSPKLLQHTKRILKVYAGHSHSGFIDENQDLYTFGFNNDYRLMISEEKIVLKPKRVKLKGVKTAGFGINHTCVITQNGEVYCGGAGTDGQLGVILNQQFQNFQQYQSAQRKFQKQNKEKICPLVKLKEFSEQNRAYKIACGEAFTTLLTEKKEVYTFGRTSFNRLGHNNNSPTKILQDIDNIAAGCRHGFAWNSKGKVYGWGFNMYNQLGIENCVDLKKPQLIQSLSSTNLMQISCGYFHSAALGV